MSISASGSLFSASPSSFKNLLNKIYYTQQGSSLEEVRVFYSHLILLAGSLSPEDMKKLQPWLAQILAFPQLREEQAQLATELGKWCQAHDSSNALYYFAIALNIEETKERHVLASDSFVRWVIATENYKKRLTYAYNTDNDEQFFNVLRGLKGFTPLCCKESDFLALIKQAQDVLLQNSRETRLDFINKYTEILDCYKVPPLCNTPPSKTYREALLHYRKSFEKPGPYLDPFRELFRVLVKDAFILAGPPPCGYDLRAMGSLAGRPCPYSDLEWFILVEDQKHFDYFKSLAKILELQIISLGETPASSLPVFTCLGSKHRSGLHVDPGANLALDNSPHVVSEPMLLATQVVCDFLFMQTGSLHTN